jgi:hypothetical protein
VISEFELSEVPELVPSDPVWLVEPDTDSVEAPWNATPVSVAWIFAKVTVAVTALTPSPVMVV